MAINNPVIADADIIQDTAVAIQEKDHGGKMGFPDIPSRIRALPTNLIPKTIIENGVYNETDDNADGYDVVTVDVPEKNTLDDYFANTLEVADISSATSIINDFFRNKSSLINVIMPNVTSIGGSAFYNCTNLALTALPDGITSIGANAFIGCTGILYLDFSEFTQIPTLNVNAFARTIFPFYFRDQQQLDEWAVATNWSTYAGRFQIKPSGVS